MSPGNENPLTTKARRTAKFLTSIQYQESRIVFIRGQVSDRITRYRTAGIRKSGYQDVEIRIAGDQGAVGIDD